MVELGNLRKDRNIKIMCGRYVLYSKEKFKNKYNINISPNYNISPNQEVFVIDQNMNIMKLKWGIRAEWKKSLIINARSETMEMIPIYHVSKNNSRSIKITKIISNIGNEKRTAIYIKGTGF